MFKFSSTEATPNTGTEMMAEKAVDGFTSSEVNEALATARQWLTCHMYEHRVPLAVRTTGGKWEFVIRNQMRSPDEEDEVRVIDCLAYVQQGEEHALPQSNGSTVCCRPAWCRPL